MFYTAKIKQSGDWWEVTFPEKSNVITCGTSLKNALEMAEDALNMVIEMEFEDEIKLVESKIKPNKAKGLYGIQVNPCLEVSYRLLEARKGKTQGSIATKAGITQQAYQKLESGKRSNPTLKTLAKVAKALGKRLDVHLV